MSQSCFDKAAELLARRAHFRRELELKLRQRRFPPEEVEATLERLAGLGLVDDAATARAFVAERLRRGGEGARRLRAELERRGAAAEAIEASLAELPVDENEAATAAAARWRRGAGRKDAAALARHLERKGFSRRVIFAVLETSAAGSSDELPDQFPDD